MNVLTRRARAITALALLATSAVASAQGLPAPRLDSLFPAGGKVGSTVEVQIAGADLDEVRELHFSEPSVKAQFVAPGKFKVTVGEAAVSVLDVRAVGRYGISNPRAFAINQALEEVLQKTPNHVPERAQRIALGCVVNGRFSGNDDFYLLKLDKGQRVILDCISDRLDSGMEPAIAVQAPDGREAGFDDEHFGRDPLVDLTAHDAGDYLIRVRDFYFRGGGAYRLCVGRLCVLDAILPGAVAPGMTAKATIIGRNLPAGKPLPGPWPDGKDREQLTLNLTAPLSPRLSVPTPTPGIDFRTFHHALGDAYPIALRLEEGPHLAEIKPNDAPERAMELPAAGAVVTGRLEKYRDSAWFRARLKAKQTYFVNVAGDRIDAAGDYYVQVFGPKGEQIAAFDDHGPNLGGAFRPAHRDPYGSFEVKDEGEHRLVVRDRTRQGGPRHRFVLSLSPPRPDFSVFVCSNLTENQVAPRTLRAGASEAFDLVVLRRDGFTDEVVCTVEGLPPGVHCPPAHVSAGQERGVIVFTADRDTADWHGPLRVRCRARIGGKEVERIGTASVMTSTSTDPQSLPPSRLAHEVCLAVRSGAPFGLTASPAEATVVKGQKMRLKVELRRYAPGFTGKIALTALSAPPGWTVPRAEIAAGANETMIEVPLTAGPGTYTFGVRGEATVPLIRDPKQPAKETPVALPSNLITVRVDEKK